MRPRYVLQLINFCKGSAIDFGRERIDEQDIEDGVSSFSTHVVKEINLEIKDVLGGTNDILYVFLGESREMRLSKIEELISKVEADKARLKGFIALLLWHGVLGFRRNAEEVSYIYNVNYDLRRLTGLIEKSDDDPIMQVNPAFWPSLEMV
jgi:hypothetical protein